MLFYNSIKTCLQSSFSDSPEAKRQLKEFINALQQLIDPEA